MQSHCSHCSKYFKYIKLNNAYKWQFSSRHSFMCKSHTPDNGWHKRHFLMTSVQPTLEQYFAWSEYTIQKLVNEVQHCSHLYFVRCPKAFGYQNNIVVPHRQNSLKRVQPTAQTPIPCVYIFKASADHIFNFLTFLSLAPRFSRSPNYRVRCVITA